MKTSVLGAAGIFFLSTLSSAAILQTDDSDYGESCTEGPTGKCLPGSNVPFPVYPPGSGGTSYLNGSVLEQGFRDLSGPPDFFTFTVTTPNAFSFMVNGMFTAYGLMTCANTGPYSDTVPDLAAPCVLKRDSSSSPTALYTFLSNLVPDPSSATPMGCGSTSPCTSVDFNVPGNAAGAVFFVATGPGATPPVPQLVSPEPSSSGLILIGLAVWIAKQASQT